MGRQSRGNLTGSARLALRTGNQNRKHSAAVHTDTFPMGRVWLFLRLGLFKTLFESCRGTILTAIKDQSFRGGVPCQVGTELQGQF